MTLMMNNPTAPPTDTAQGVRTVATEVSKRPKPTVHFPPNFSANRPPGKWVAT